ncbi:MAG: GGDEF and EAL domain-containing protein [Ruminococcus sp.]|nr:GGDEF and EAL domain-containing protein [Ruminococcus sp.]
MEQDLNQPERKKSKAKTQKMLTRMLIPMLILILFQLVTFFSVLAIGGEFSFIKKYAYDTLIEKTRNRTSYVEKELSQKITFVNEHASEINNIVRERLEENNSDISDLKTDKELNRQIMEDSVDSIIYLLRRSLANDVFIILETGELYNNGGKTDNKAGMYLRDLDTSTDSGYKDLLMEMGYSSISKDFGIILDSGWKARMEADTSDKQSYDFYYKTIQNAQENNTMPIERLGYWSGFSGISSNSAGSMKYTVPLIADDGTVYGVLGIGLTEKTILANLPPNDFVSESACYVLCNGMDNSDVFNICMHSGASFGRLIGSQETLRPNKQIDENMYVFPLKSGIDAVGNIQVMNLYNSESIYAEEQWALISVAEKSDVLFIFSNLIKMMFISALISIAVSIVVMSIGCNSIAKPISAVIKTINSKREYNEAIRFQSTKIYELDQLTDAIIQLQINVHNFSSQVSKMIRIADVGLCTFMYDSMDDSVFVAQSMLKLLNLSVKYQEDIVISRQLFLENIIADKTREIITECLSKKSNDTETSFSKEYCIEQPESPTVWMRISVVCNSNKIIGVLQDITNTILERQRIEYERDYDGTTGLLNRHAYYHKINDIFGQPEKLGTACIIMLDLDNLKYVNDTYGHDFGDDYIKTAANVLKEFKNYNGIVSRLSGDEFNVCLYGFESKNEIWEVINTVREKLINSYCLLSDGTHYKIRASAGIAWYPDDSTSSELLMKYADFAMYTIKHTTKGEITEFDMNAYAKDSVLITGVEEMNKIIDECRIRYAFHSIISARTGEVYGYEALMRPQSAILHSPAELLRIAKTGAKLYEIERLTWIEALRAFRKQREIGNIPENAYIFVNTISNAVLESPDIDIVEKENMDILSKIVMEVTESEDTNDNFNMRKLERLEKWNAHLALDDFGTGYNSDYALITMHPNIIKIDRSIISGCDKDVSRSTIIENIVKLARTRNIKVLAEGVETETELKTVIECGVDLLQGYFINRPVFEPQPITQEVVDKIMKYKL